MVPGVLRLGIVLFVKVKYSGLSHMLIAGPEYGMRATRDPGG